MFNKNLQILQALAKGTEPKSPRTYGTVVGWDGKRFIVTDGFKIMCFEPVAEDRSFSFPKHMPLLLPDGTQVDPKEKPRDATPGDPISLLPNLLQRAEIKFPNSTHIWDQAKLAEALSDEARETIERIIKEGSFKKRPLYFEPATLRISTGIEGTYAVDLVKICELKKALPKNWCLIALSWSAKHMLLRLDFSDHVTAIICGVEGANVREMREEMKKQGKR